MPRHFSSSFTIWRIVCSISPPFGYMSPEPWSFTSYVGDDRPVVPDAAAVADDVLRARVLAEQTLRVDALGVVREALVHPHVGVVLRRDVVAEPLVRALVHDDEIPLEAEPGA